MWAVAQGVEQALAGNPDLLLLTDADIEHPRRASANLFHCARQRSQPCFGDGEAENRHLAEKALIPAFTFFFFLLYPPAGSAIRGRKTAGAAGGCMLVRPSALSRPEASQRSATRSLTIAPWRRIIKVQVGGSGWASPVIP